MEASEIRANGTGTSYIMKVLAVVPARAGSKSIPGKNILPLAGHPLLAYSVAAGMQSSAIDRTICSTDSQEIAKIAQAYGAQTPFLRPVELAGDDITDVQVMRHVLQWLKDHENYEPDIVVNLRPTSPIRFIKDVNKSVQMLIDNPKADSVRSVSLPPVTPYKMWTINAAGSLKPLLSHPEIKEPFNAPRQKLPEVWQQTGALDVVRAGIVLKRNSMSGDVVLPYKLEAQHFVDIDYPYDFELAERVLNETACIVPSKERF